VDTLSYKTVSASKETVNKEWLLIDASNEVLGRLSSKAAKILRGKHKSLFTPHIDCGDNVIVINAEKIKITGAKFTNKKYFSHSGYPGGQKRTTPEELYKKNPAKIIEKSIKGMLPKNRLGNAIYKNLYVYTGPEHPHTAQKPKQIDLNNIK